MRRAVEMFAPALPGVAVGVVGAVWLGWRGVLVACAGVLAVAARDVIARWLR